MTAHDAVNQLHQTQRHLRKLPLNRTEVLLFAVDMLLFCLRHCSIHGFTSFVEDPVINQPGTVRKVGTSEHQMSH